MKKGKLLLKIIAVLCLLFGLCFSVSAANHVEKIDNPIPLKTLKEKFGFSAPQSYAYDTRYPDLVDYISKISKHTII